MAHSENRAVIATGFLHREMVMIDTSTERLIPLGQIPASAIPGRGDKPVRPCTLRSWCASGVRGVRLELVKVGGTRCMSIEALNRFFQAVTVAANDVRQPKPVGSRPRRDQTRALREDLASLTTRCGRRGGDGSNGKPSRSWVTRPSYPMLEALALERLPHRQLRVLLALESLTRDKSRCFPGNRAFARLAAMSVRSLQQALADLVDQLRDMTRRLEESGKNGPFMDNLVQITEFAELKQSVEDLEAKLKEKEEQEDHR